MNLSSNEKRTAKLAFELMMSRKAVVGTTFPGPGGEIRSKLLELEKMEHENKDLTGYLHCAIINAITRPLAYMFFLSNSSFDADAVEKLASYFERNTIDLGLWFETED